MVLVPSSVPEFGHLYAVTNNHVVAEGYMALRLNTKNGNTDVIQTEYHKWESHPNDDIAVCPIALDEQLNIPRSKQRILLIVM